MYKNSSCSLLTMGVSLSQMFVSHNLFSLPVGFLSLHLHFKYFTLHMLDNSSKLESWAQFIIPQVISLKAVISISQLVPDHPLFVRNWHHVIFSQWTIWSRAESTDNRQRWFWSNFSQTNVDNIILIVDFPHGLLLLFLSYIIFCFSAFESPDSANIYSTVVLYVFIFLWCHLIT